MLVRRSAMEEEVRGVAWKKENEECKKQMSQVRQMYLFDTASPSS